MKEKGAGAVRACCRVRGDSFELSRSGLCWCWGQPLTQLLTEIAPRDLVSPFVAHHFVGRCVPPLRAAAERASPLLLLRRPLPVCQRARCWRGPTRDWRRERPRGGSACGVPSPHVGSHARTRTRAPRVVRIAPFPPSLRKCRRCGPAAALGAPLPRQRAPRVCSKIPRTHSRVREWVLGQPRRRSSACLRRPVQFAGGHQRGGRKALGKLAPTCVLSSSAGVQAQGTRVERALRIRGLLSSGDATPAVCGPALPWTCQRVSCAPCARGHAERARVFVLGLVRLMRANTRYWGNRGGGRGGEGGCGL